MTCWPAGGLQIIALTHTQSVQPHFCFVCNKIESCNLRYIVINVLQKEQGWRLRRKLLCLDICRSCFTFGTAEWGTRYLLKTDILLIDTYQSSSTLQDVSLSPLSPMQISTALSPIHASIPLIFHAFSLLTPMIPSNLVWLLAYLVPVSPYSATEIILMHTRFPLISTPPPFYLYTIRNVMLMPPVIHLSCSLLIDVHLCTCATFPLLFILPAPSLFLYIQLPLK